MDNTLRPALDRAAELIASHLAALRAVVEERARLTGASPADAVLLGDAAVRLALEVATKRSGLIETGGNNGL